MQVFNTFDPGDTNFFWSLRRFDAFDVVFHVDGPSHLFLLFKAAIKHRGLIGLTPYEGALDYSMHAALRGPVSNPSQFPTDPVWELAPFIKGAISASNIVSRTQHYAEPIFFGYQKITLPGDYRVEILGKSRTDAAPSGTNALAELCKETNVLNSLLVVVI